MVSIASHNSLDVCAQHILIDNFRGVTFLQIVSQELKAFDTGIEENIVDDLEQPGAYVKFAAIIGIQK